ncbi:MAG: hypothetical protein LAP87_27525 [Acidobacteriia bacterium]|nr:hypothetical protein [Terriglobia bacterium]
MLDGIEAWCRYCEEASFPMTKIPLERLLTLTEDPNLLLHGMAQLFSDAEQRLRDEAASSVFLRVPVERARVLTQEIVM